MWIPRSLSRIKERERFFHRYPGAADTDLVDLGALTGPGQVAVWQTGGLYTFAVLFDDTVNVVAQYSDPPKPPTRSPIRSRFSRA